MIVYKAVNSTSGTIYFGITNNLRQRKWSHKSVAKRKKSPFYDAIKSYGFDHFNWYIVKDDITKLEAQILEETLIRKCRDFNIPIYNLHRGGSIGFSMRDKPNDEYLSWRAKLKVARQGRKPALGMKHSEENKKYAQKVSQEYWATQEIYSLDVLNYSFINANAKFGISKTHYYRLKKRVLIND